MADILNDASLPDARESFGVWQPIETAQADGTLCRLRFRDVLGPYTGPGPFFLHDDGHWYRVDPPQKLRGTPTHWMPTKEPSDSASTESDPTGSVPK